MKMTLSEVRTKYQDLIALANCQLPSKLAYGIAKNLKKLGTEAELIEKQRLSVAESYAKKDENGTPEVMDGRFVFEKKEDEKAFQNDFNEFLNTETEVAIHKCSCTVLDMLDDPRYDILTPTQMVALDFMMEQPTE